MTNNDPSLEHELAVAASRQRFSDAIRDAQAAGPRKELPVHDPGWQEIEGQLVAIQEGQPDRVVSTTEDSVSKLEPAAFVPVVENAQTNPKVPTSLAQRALQAFGIHRTPPSKGA
jgi:hypothetical protein